MEKKRNRSAASSSASTTTAKTITIVESELPTWSSRTTVATPSSANEPATEKAESTSRPSPESKHASPHHKYKHSSPSSIDPSTPYTMTVADLYRKLEVSDRGRLRTQVYACVIACMSSASFGMALGWSSPVALQLSNSPCANHTSTSGSWFPKKGCQSVSLLSGLMLLGASLGILPWHYFSNKIGPRKTLMIQDPFFFLTWFALAMPGVSTKTDLAARFFSGLFSICHMVIGERLLLDTVHRSLSGIMFISFHTSVFLGALFVETLGLVIENSQWISGTCMAFPLLHLLMLYFARESPVFLYKTSQVLAEESMRWYRGRTNIYEDLHYIQRDSEYDRLDYDAYGYMLYSKVVLKGLLIICGVVFFRVFSGYYMFLLYSCIHIYYKHEFSSHATEATVLIGLTYILSTMFWMIFHMRYELPVKKLLISSCVLSGFFLLLISGYLYVYADFSQHTDRYTYWIPITLTMLSIFSTDIGLNYMPLVLLLDYMPLQVYRRAQRILHIFLWFTVFIMVQGYALLDRRLHKWIFFLLLSICTFGGAVFCRYFVVETRGKSLTKIQVDLGGNPIGNRGAHLRNFTFHNKRTVFRAAVPNELYYQNVLQQ